MHTVIIQLKPIKNFSWSPTDHILLICTENSKLYSFTLSKIYVFEIEIDMKLNLGFNKVSWSNDGKFFILQDKTHFIIGNPLINNENKIEEEEQELNTEKDNESNNYENRQDNNEGDGEEQCNENENSHNYQMENENYNDNNYNENENDNYDENRNSEENK